MTRDSQKQEERAVADQYLRLRGIIGTVEASEHPDFLVTTAGGILGLEVTAYGHPVGREVESTWEGLLEFASTFRDGFPEINHLNVWLNFRLKYLPPRSQFPAFCEAVVVFLKRNKERATRSYLNIPVDPELDPLLARYVSKVTIRLGKIRMDWYWPSHSGGGVGTSDEELLAAVSKKLSTYQEPADVTESHLVVYGGGPGLSRIAAPWSTEQLEGFPLVNAALAAGPFEVVAVLDLRDFLWTRGKGWSTLAKVDEQGNYDTRR